MSEAQPLPNVGYTVNGFPGNCGIRFYGGFPYQRDNAEYFKNFWNSLDIEMEQDKTYCLALVSLNDNQLMKKGNLDKLMERGFLEMDKAHKNPNSGHSIQVFYRYFPNGKGVPPPAAVKEGKGKK